MTDYQVLKSLDELHSAVTDLSAAMESHVPGFGKRMEIRHIKKTPAMADAERRPAEDDGPAACWQAMIKEVPK